MPREKAVQRTAGARGPNGSNSQRVDTHPLCNLSREHDIGADQEGGRDENHQVIHLAVETIPRAHLYAFDLAERSPRLRRFLDSLQAEDPRGGRRRRRRALRRKHLIRM